jgi:hypothetical protein
MAAGLALLIALCASAQVQVAPAVPQDRPPFQPRMVPDMNEEMPALRERRNRLAAQMAATMGDMQLGSVQVSDRVLGLVKGLDDPSYEVRDRTTGQLMDPAIDDREILALLDRGGLRDEAHERLLRVAVRRVQEKPRGAIGVRMANAPPDRAGVVVQQTIPGLPADKVLLPGDVIERINDTPIRSTDELADLLQGLSPGAEVNVVVTRVERDAQGRPMLGPDGKPLERRREFRMPLGNAAELDRADAGAQANWPPGMRGGNLSLERRRAQVMMIEARFARPLPPTTVVPPPPADPMQTTAPAQPGIAPQD